MKVVAKKLMLECLRAAKSPIGIYLEALLQQIVELRGLFCHFGELPQLIDVSPGRDSSLRLFTVDKAHFEKISQIGRCFLYHPFGEAATNFLNHDQVLFIGVGFEQQFTCQQFYHDTADRPNVCQLIPVATLQNHLRGTILPGADNSRMLLIEFCCAPKIDNSHWCLSRQPVFTFSIFPFDECRIF